MDAIEDDNFPPGTSAEIRKTLSKFSLRSAVQSDKDRAKIERDFRKAAPTFDMCFWSAHGMEKNAVESTSFLYGFVQAYPKHRLKLHIAFELIEPLLDPTLNAAEKMIEVFKLAATILHESAHAFWQNYLRSQFAGELYFEDDPVAELGFALETAVFGGICLPLVPDRFDSDATHPSGGVFRRNWPSFKNDGYRADMPTLVRKPADWNTVIEWPIPIVYLWLAFRQKQLTMSKSYFVSLEEEDFWQIHVKKFGAQATEMGPRFIGTSRTSPPGMSSADARRNNKLIRDKVLLSPEELLGFKELPIDSSMELLEVQAITRENKRRFEGAYIQAQMREAMWQAR